MTSTHEVPPQADQAVDQVPEQAVDRFESLDPATGAVVGRFPVHDAAAVRAFYAAHVRPSTATFSRACSRSISPTRRE